MRHDDLCEVEFSNRRPFWHVCTPGDLSGILFRDEEDYVFGMNAVALSAAEYSGKVEIYTFQIMSNHFHFVVAGDMIDVEAFFTQYFKRIRRYLVSKYMDPDFKLLKFKAFPVNDLKYLRNVILYVNRNGYVASRNETPFSYRWGANAYYFNDLMQNENRVKLSSLSIDARRKMFHSRIFRFPAGYYLTNGYVSPVCYCNIQAAQCFFRDANHYFHSVSRQVESFSDLAKELGDRVTFTDDEIYFIVLSLCRKDYNVDLPYQLDKDAKIEMANQMHHKYNASNKQIRRILRLDETIIDSLFPNTSAKKKYK